MTVIEVLRLRVSEKKSQRRWAMASWSHRGNALQVGALLEVAD
jgi:hypothetical protein